MKKKCIKILNTGSSKINALLLINSTSFASCGEDGIIQIWSLNKSSSYQFKIIKKMNGHDGKVNCLCKVDESIIASGGSDGCIRIWNVGSGICVGVLMGHCGGVNMVIKSGVSDNERIVLVSVSDDKSVKMWNVNQRKCVGEIENAHDGKVKIVKETEDGKIVTAGDNGIIKVWL
jgi:WD40 repeat protein